MSVVNQTRLLAYAYPTVPGKDLRVSDMCASITSKLRKRERTVLPVALRQQTHFEPLGRVADSAGNNKKSLTRKQQEGSRAVGSSMQRSCYVCRKYQEAYRMACGVCKRCGTCLCLPRLYPGRPLSCQAEHMTSNDPAVSRRVAFQRRRVLQISW